MSDSIYRHRRHELARYIVPEAGDLFEEQPGCFIRVTVVEEMTRYGDDVLRLTLANGSFAYVEPTQHVSFLRPDVPPS